MNPIDFCRPCTVLHYLVLNPKASHQMAPTAGAAGLRLSSNGRCPVSSWKAMTPADHTSDAGSTWEDSDSGAIYLGARGRRGECTGKPVSQMARQWCTWCKAPLLMAFLPSAMKVKA